MTINSKRKGKVGELEAAAELRRVLGVAARRGQQYCGSPDSPDLETTLEGVHFEVKRTERLQLYAALQQAIEDAGDATPVVLHRANRKPWVAVVRLDDLPRLAQLVAAALPRGDSVSEGEHG